MGTFRFNVIVPPEVVPYPGQAGGVVHYVRLLGVLAHVSYQLQALG